MFRIFGKVLPAIVLLVLAGITFLVIALSPPFFPETIITRFESPDGAVQAVLTNKKRVRLGDETNIFLSAGINGDFNEQQRIDHNGRLSYSERHVLFVTSDNQWIRACKDIEEPKTGKLAWKTNAELYPHLPPNYFDGWRETGQWVVVETENNPLTFDLYCDAYINIPGNVKIRDNIPNANQEQRESKLFALISSEQSEGIIEGAEVQWLRMDKVPAAAED